MEKMERERNGEDLDSYFCLLFKNENKDPSKRCG